jgi:Uma2 family endonuclease
MGWLIDPEEETVFVYFDDRTVAIFEEKGDRIPVTGFAEAFHLTVGQLFTWLEE